MHPTRVKSPFSCHVILGKSLAFAFGSQGVFPEDVSPNIKIWWTYPMPQLSQQVSRSWEEISTLTLALLWIHTLSEMASAAPNACVKPCKTMSKDATNTNCNPKSHCVHQREDLTQHEPQEPWSLISLRVGQLGHCSLASKFLGSLRLLAYCTLVKSKARSVNQDLEGRTESKRYEEIYI